MADIKNEIPDQEYAYGFNDGDVSVFKTPKGINEEIVTEISKIKNEPEWMLEYRLKSYRCFMEKPMPTWGVNLDRIDFDEYTYYVRPSDKQTNKWEEVPETIKQTFNKLGIPEAEQKYLSGVSTQYESEVVYHNMLKEVTEKGVIFLDIDSGLREYPEIFRKYFDTVIPYNDNKFSALNGAVWLIKERISTMLKGVLHQVILVILFMLELLKLLWVKEQNAVIQRFKTGLTTF